MMTSEVKSRVVLSLDTFDLRKVTAAVGEAGYQNAVQLEFEFRRFALLCALHRDLNLTPSKDVDAYWHHLVLDTQTYRQFCSTVFGEFVDHVPDHAKVGMDQEFAQTRSLYGQEFGFPDPSVWSIPGNSMTNRRPAPRRTV